MKITVIDFLNLLVDGCWVCLYNSEYELEEWSGYVSDLPEKYEDWIVDSFDPPDHRCILILNIVAE